jgi:hypothetical protein
VAASIACSTAASRISGAGTLCGQSAESRCAACAAVPRNDSSAARWASLGAAMRVMSSYGRFLSWSACSPQPEMSRSTMVPKAPRGPRAAGSGNSPARARRSVSSPERSARSERSVPP